MYLDRQVIAPEEARAMLADDPDSGFASIDPERIFDDEDAPEDNEEYADAPFKADIDDVDKAGAVYDAAWDEKYGAPLKTENASRSTPKAAKS